MLGRLPSGIRPIDTTTCWSSGDHLLIVSLPGQRVSACTCKGEDHPGPVVTKGRGAPEIDAIEVSGLL